mgnify:CR=1 FL=1
MYKVIIIEDDPMVASINKPVRRADLLFSRGGNF